MKQKRFSSYHIILVSILTLISRILGFLRDVLFVRMLGTQSVSSTSDAFLTAFRIPQVVYEILLGGALGSALVPVLATVSKQESPRAVHQLMTIMFFVISISSILLASYISWSSPAIIHYIAPGFSATQHALAARMLSIMSYFIICSALSLLCAEALRFHRQFIISSFSQILYNITFIVGLLWYAHLNTSIEFLAWCVVAGGLVQLLLNVMQYVFSSYQFALPGKATFFSAYLVFRRLLPSILSAGIAEISFFIELQFASYLPAGSISLLSYTSSFMRLPLGIFVYALTTVLFPDMVRLSTYAPQRLSFIIYEVAKVLFWVLIPIIITMTWYSHDIFATLYTYRSFTPTTLTTLQWLLTIKLISLPFLAISKVCVDALYALHLVRMPSIIFLCGTLISIGLNLILMPLYGVYGLAFSATLVAIVRTCFFLAAVNKSTRVVRYSSSFGIFCVKSCQQMMCILIPSGIVLHVMQSHIPPYLNFFRTQCGLWLWVAPVCALAALIMVVTRKHFGLKMYFVDRLTQ